MNDILTKLNNKKFCKIVVKIFIIWYAFKSIYIKINVYIKLKETMVYSAYKMYHSMKDEVL